MSGRSRSNRRNRRAATQQGTAQPVRKVFGPSVPASFSAGEAASGMTPSSPFSPGEPIGPYDGYSRTPRSRDFVTGYNISNRPRTHERVSFQTLKGLVDAYDVAQMCIWHRIDSIRAMDWSLVPARGYHGDADDAINLGMAALERPDRQTPFTAWLAMWLYDVLAFDAGTLYRLRNRRGDAIGLRVVDGTDIAPLLDYWGNSPEPPAEAYVQYVQGLPWNWLTRDDLIYQPFRPVPGSPYGRAPLESILLNANTDLRFQAYFLQRFTEGNIPEAFASAPETWSPDQIEQFQEYWDAFMLGDQSMKNQIRWIPGGSTIAWSNEKDFSDQFSLFLMRKTCAAFHVVPADLGFTENVNRSSGETQADVQHRVGDLPLLTHVEGALTHFLRHDLGLPLEFAFDTGQEKEDRLALAQAWSIYVNNGFASADEGREQLLGLPGDPHRPTPRFIMTGQGPMPLAAVDGTAGKVDPETYGPAADQPNITPPPTPPAPGQAPAAPKAPPAVPAGTPAAPPAAEKPSAPAAPAAVAKDGEAAAPTTGVTTETGIVSYDLVGHHDDDEGAESEGREELVKRELTAFRRFRQARRRAGQWRDFEFRSVDTVQAHRLNDAGRLAVRKATGQVAVAGLAVRAADTGRVLMLQRALCDDDPAAGTWECPGGHLEADETPLQGAWREWAEETTVMPPPGEMTGTWVSPDGIYQGIVWTVPSESCVPVNGERGIVANPDDPDGDQVEAIAWWDPAQLAGNPAVRPELLDSIGRVMAALGQPQEGDEAMCPCGLPVVFDELNGWQHADGSVSHDDDDESVSDKMPAVVKAGGRAPKGPAVTASDADLSKGAAEVRAQAIAPAQQRIVDGLGDLADRLASGDVTDGGFVDHAVTVLRGGIREGLTLGTRHAGQDVVAKLSDEFEEWRAAFDARFAQYATVAQTAYDEGQAISNLSKPGDWLIRWDAKPGACDLCEERDGNTFEPGDLPGLPGMGGFRELATVCRGGPNCRCSIQYLAPDGGAQGTPATPPPMVPTAPTGRHRVVPAAVSDFRQQLQANVTTARAAREAGHFDPTSGPFGELLDKIADQRADQQRPYLAGLVQDLHAASDRTKESTGGQRHGHLGGLVAGTVVTAATAAALGGQQAAQQQQSQPAGQPVAKDAEVHLAKVGPKGYIHGWIHVGPQSVGSRVFHPHHGHGTVTRIEGGKTHVEFDGGKEHSFEAHHKPDATQHFEPRGEGDSGSTPSTAGAKPEGNHGKEASTSSPARPALSAAGYEALQPRRGGWTTTTREKTLKELKADPDGSTLIKTLDSFQSGGSTAIPRLRTDIEKALNGEQLPEGRSKSIDVLLGAIAGSDVSDRHLYRGMSIPGDPDSVAEQYAVGTPFNISLGSFSSDKKLAQDFTVSGAGKKVRAKRKVPVLIDWSEGDKRALPIENMSKSRVFANEREFLSSGRFTVTGVRRRGDALIVSVRQEGTL